MKKTRIALCDLDMDYITRFASYIMERNFSSRVELSIFTTPESFFADEGSFDLGIMTSDFMEVSAFKNQGTIMKKYLLSEDKEQSSNGEWRSICKYQSMDSIIEEIDELKECSLKTAEDKRSGEKEGTKIWGIYSPMSHELQLPFAMALCESLSEKGRMLFIDFQEVSIMPSLIQAEASGNLMDLIFELNASGNGVPETVSKYVHRFMGMDYIAPFSNPDDLAQLGEDDLKVLFRALYNLNYDGIVLLLGKAVPGFGELLSRMNQLILLSKPGDYFNKGNELFMDYLEKAGIEIQTSLVRLPMNAGNLKDGTYCIGELLRGNLGLFVKKLFDEGVLSYQNKVACHAT